MTRICRFIAANPEEGPCFHYTLPRKLASRTDLLYRHFCLYNKTMHRICLSLLLFAYCCLSVSGWAANTIQHSSSSAKAPATPTALESRFVSFQPNFPLMPKSLDLHGYEREKAIKSYPVLSPDKTKMALAEVFYQPAIQQTYSQVSLFPTGSQPALADLLPPEVLKQVELEKQMNQADNPSYIPQVELSTVNPQPFWNRYQPEQQKTARKIILRMGFDNTQPFRVDVVQVADWSQDGSRLLMVHRPGVHHLGIWKTVPIVYDTFSDEVIRLAYLPDLIWQSQTDRFPELKGTARKAWDIRPLGWSAQNPQEIIAKLVMFEGQSEVITSYWSYNLQTGKLYHLDNSIVTPNLIARNGWIARFVDPTHPGEPVIYEPGQAPPPKAPTAPSPKRTGFNRILFWKK